MAGSIEFEFNGKKTQVFYCFKSLNILGHAQIEEVTTGSQCGGHGKCGRDLIQIDKGSQKLVNPPNEIEKQFLTPEDLDQGIRLACQAFPNQDDLELKVKVL